MLSTFSCLCWPPVCLFWRNVYLGFLPVFQWFFFLLLSCMSCLYVLEIKPLSVTSFAKIFSHSVGCLFVFLMVSFAVQKLLSLIRSHWFVYLFIYLFIYFRAAHVAYGSSQARSWIRAAAAGLHHSHSNARTEPPLQPTPQLMTMPDSQPIEQGLGLNPHPHGY